MVVDGCPAEGESANPDQAEHSSINPVEVRTIRDKNLLARFLYPNPVCLLTSRNAAGCAHAWNIMTISWLTPINNMGQFVFSINKRRHTAANLQDCPEFVLSVPVRGMEEMVLAIGKCSGEDVDKATKLNIPLCSPGFSELGSAPVDLPCDYDPRQQSSALGSKKKHQRSAKKQLKADAVARLESGVGRVAVRNCCAHLLCTMLSSQEADHDHWLMTASVELAHVRAEYWSGKTFQPLHQEVAPFLTFFGSQTFGYVLAFDPTV